MTIGGTPMTVRWDVVSRVREWRGAHESPANFRASQAGFTAPQRRAYRGVADITQWRGLGPRVMFRCHGVASMWRLQETRRWLPARGSGRIVTERCLPEKWSPEPGRHDISPTRGPCRVALRRFGTDTDGPVDELRPGTVGSGPVSVACSQHVFVGGRLWSGPTVADTSPHSQGYSGTVCWSGP